MELPNTVARQMQNVKLKKVLNVHKEDIFAAYVLDIEVEEPPGIYDRYQEGEMLL